MYTQRTSSRSSTLGMAMLPPVSLNKSQIQCDEALDKAAIGELSSDLIDSMTQDELVRVISTSELLTLRRDDFLLRRLPFYDCETLRRLAHLARHCCQNQSQ